MATTHNKISYSSTTEAGTNAGLGIMCDNQDIYCDSENYWCDGAVVFLDVAIGQGLRCSDRVVLCSSQAYDCQGAVVYNKESYP